MSEKMNRGTQDLSIYNDMTTEELEEILRSDADSSEGGESDTETLLYIMDLLANRKSADTPEKTPEQAWDAFQRYYLAGEEICMGSEPKKKSRTKTKQMLHRVAAAAVIVLVIGIPLTVSALAGKWGWDVVPFRTGETFSWVSRDASGLPEAIPNDGSPCAVMQAFLLENGVDPRIVPAWIPEGFEKYNFEKGNVDWEDCFASFRRGEQALNISVMVYDPENPIDIQAGDEWYEVYRRDGVDYHIFPNYDQIEATWIDGEYQCIIGGDVTLEEIKQMIDSIKRG